jgi:hypothetical protein
MKMTARSGAMKTPLMRAFGQRKTKPRLAVADQEKKPVVEAGNLPTGNTARRPPPAYPPRSPARKRSRSPSPMPEGLGWRTATPAFQTSFAKIVSNRDLARAADTAAGERRRRWKPQPSREAAHYARARCCTTF